MPAEQLNNPLSTGYDQQEDARLIEAAINGSGQALEALAKRHQHYIYNIALRMVLSPFDAEDITQEDEKYQALFQDTPFQEKAHAERLMRTILQDERVRRIFSLN